MDAQQPAAQTVACAMQCCNKAQCGASLAIDVALVDVMYVDCRNGLAL